MKKIDLSQITQLANGAAVKFVGRLLLAIADGKITPDELADLIAAGERLLAGLRHAHTNTQALLDRAHIIGEE